MVVAAVSVVEALYPALVVLAVMVPLGRVAQVSLGTAMNMVVVAHQHLTLMVSILAKVGMETALARLAVKA